MFITFQQDLINVNHLISITPKRGVTQLTLVTGQSLQHPNCRI